MHNPKPRVLITGGAGLLSLNWALAMRAKYAVTLGLHQRSVVLEGVDVVHADLMAPENFMQTLERVRPDVVLHTVGLTSVEVCEVEPERAWHVNVELALNVCQACAKMEVPLIHISTDHLFSGQNALETELATAAPMNVYARTKAEAEARLLDCNPSVLVVRTNFYGWGPSYRASFSDSIISSLRAKRAINLFRDVFFTPILIESLAAAVSDLWAFKAFGIYHVVGDERISKFDFGCKVASRFGLDVDLIRPSLISDHVGLVQRPRDMSLSNNKACHALGRSMGGVDEHLLRLFDQERMGVAEELGRI